MAQFGKRKVRPEELAMCQLKKGFSVELNPILKKNIERSGRIMGELAVSGWWGGEGKQYPCAMSVL